ncbi:unnamed protein product, partial [Mesorhabditis spiculigera]
MRLIIGLLLVVVQTLALTVIEEYGKCKDDQGFGNATLVCDLGNRLSERTTAKLTYLLNDLRDNIPCKCETGCDRVDGRDGYLGLIMVTESKNSKSLAQDAKQIYEDAGMNLNGCDHGLLLIYLKDSQQVGFSILPLIIPFYPLL